MVDFFCISLPRKNIKSDAVSCKTGYKKHDNASIPVDCSGNAFKCVASVDHSTFGVGTAVEIGQFLLKVAAMEMVRRFCKVHCPYVWHGLQALQIICYHPFKLIAKWAPFKCLEKSMQPLSTPMLVLSIATCFSKQPGCVEGSSSCADDSQTRIDQQSHASLDLSPQETRCTENVPKSIALTDWMSDLLAELHKEGLILPERINLEELQRFYDAVDRDFSCFVSSVKKTVRWRQSFEFLSSEELEYWSKMVFWHGCDVRQRPCLIIRMGLACSSLGSEVTSLTQVVVSQIEYGVLHLVNAKDPQITVVMDCEGLPQFSLPVQTMKSCMLLLQDHYPNHLAALIIIRLPAVARIITRTLLQVLSPATQQKLKIEGENYRNLLLEYLQTLPSFLGGDCSCPRCSGGTSSTNPKETGQVLDSTSAPESPSYQSQADNFDRAKCLKKILKAVFVGVIMLLLCMVFMFGVRMAGDVSSYNILG